jgi:C4-dicarboxylate-specific signal transduction histidine kinase
VPSLPLLVRVDSLDLQLMLLNLVINAEQAVFASETKTISVAATADGDSVRISVTDSGGGPAPTERFVSTKSPQTAAGLGLPATEALAKHYGGEVRLRQADGGIEAALILPRAGV